MNINIKQQLNGIPSSPGVYFFKNSKGKILYIGKAVNLKARVKSYFVAGKSQMANGKLPGNHPKSRMISEITRIDFKITDNEIDALILESQFIKKYLPQYNVLLKDDKNYFYVVITDDKFPKVFITHQPPRLKTKNLKLKTILGPYTDGQALKMTLRYLRKIFPYCTCRSEHKNKCLKAHLGLCLGACCVSAHLADTIFKNSCLRRQADPSPAIFKDSVRPALESNKVAQKTYKNNIKFLIAILSGKKTTILKTLEKEMRISVKSEDFENAAKIRDQIKGLKNVFEHRVFRYLEHIRKNELDAENVMGKIQELFGAKIERIEFYDISNIQGELATGSMVVFDGEKINKNEYRKFKIKSVIGMNDPVMIEEVLMRRFARSISDDKDMWTMPDLIIVDGGMTQLTAAKKVLNQYGLDIKCASLAKNPDRLFMDDGRQIPLKSLSENLGLFLQRLRDEAHRFAISYHKKLRHKKLKEEFNFGK